jgi:hypothetical protein
MFFQARLRREIFVRGRGGTACLEGLEFNQFNNPAAIYLIWRGDDRVVRGVAGVLRTDRPYIQDEMAVLVERGSCRRPTAISKDEGVRRQDDFAAAPTHRLSRAALHHPFSWLGFHLDLFDLIKSEGNLEPGRANDRCILIIFKPHQPRAAAVSRVRYRLSEVPSSGSVDADEKQLRHGCTAGGHSTVDGRKLRPTRLGLQKVLGRRTRNQKRNGPSGHGLELEIGRLVHECLQPDRACDGLPARIAHPHTPRKRCLSRRGARTGSDRDVLARVRNRRRGSRLTSVGEHHLSMDGKSQKCLRQTRKSGVRPAP